MGSISKRYLTWGIILLAGFGVFAALVDTDGNAVTNETLLGDIDMGVGTAGDLKAFVLPASISSISDGTNIVDASGAVYKINQPMGSTNFVGQLALTNDYTKFATTNLVDVRDIDSDPDGRQDRRVQIGSSAEASGKITSADVSKYNNHYQAVAIGNNSKALSAASVAVGPQSRVEGPDSETPMLSSFGVALGYRAYAKGQGTIAIGSGVDADRPADQDYVTIAAAKGAAQIGPGLNETIDSLQFRGTMLVGTDQKIPSASLQPDVILYGTSNIVIGSGATANDYVQDDNTNVSKGVAIGAGARADLSDYHSPTFPKYEFNSGVAIGLDATASKPMSIALGYGSAARGNNSVSLGANSWVTNSADQCVALGGGSQIAGNSTQKSVQLGAGTCSTSFTLKFLSTMLAQGSKSSDVKILPNVLPDASTSTKGAVILDKMWNQSGWANNKAADAGVVSNALVASISTNNPAFVNAVTNCPVSLPLDSDSSLAGWGAYGTLGALLAAIIAGVANLNKNKADKATTLEGYGITDAKIENGTITLGSSTITPITQIPTATEDSLGVVKPDNDTITVDQNGMLRAEGIAAKLDAASAAPPFSDSRTYLVGEYVTYGGVLYRCKTAVTTAGDWTGTSNWEEADMTSPDATLDIMSDGRLRVVTVAGENLWMQGYDLESTSAQVLKCEKVNLLKFPVATAEAFDSTATYAVGDSVVYGGMVYKFTAAHSAGDWIGTDAELDSVSLTMPYVPVGKVGDFVLDVDNSANASVKMVAELSGLFTAFDVFVDKGNNLSDLLTFDGGEQCELYFTMTAFGTQAKPAWKVVKQVVEKQEAGS